MECRQNGMSIDFSIIRNPVGNSGVDELLTNYYLPNYESLDTLNQNGCSMTDLGVEKLLQVFQSLEGKNSVYALNLSGSGGTVVSSLENHISDEALPSLTTLFSLLPNLHNLYLESKNSIVILHSDTDLSSNGLYGVINYFISNKPPNFLYVSMRSMAVVED